MAKFSIKQTFKKLKDMWNLPPKGRYLTLKEMLSYSLSGAGVGSIYGTLMMVLTVVFIPYFYKIAAIHGYIISFVAGVCGLLFQPILGRLMEKSNTRWGKYKPFLVLMTPVMAALCIMVMWTPQYSIEKARIVYAYIVCIPAMFLGAAYNNLYYMFPSVMTPVAQERTNVWSISGLVLGLVPSVIGIILPIMRSLYLDKEYLALRLMGVISAVIGMTLAFLILKVKERIFITAESKNNEDVGIFKAIKLMSKNKPMIILAVALTLGCLRDFIGTYFTLIMQFRFGATIEQGLQISGAFSVVLGMGATIAMVTLPVISRKVSNKYIFISYTGIGILLNGVIAIIGINNIAVGLPTMLVLGISRFLVCLNCLHLLTPIMLGEIYDYQQCVTGKRLEGYIQAVVYQVVGLLTQVAMLAVGLLQTKVGFEQSVFSDFISGGSGGGATVLPQYLQEKLCHWINITYVISAVSGALMLAAMLFYPLTKKKYQEVLSELMTKSVGSTFDDELAKQAENDLSV
jgi:Na+/melibiose symporter-like transporter